VLRVVRDLHRVVHRRVERRPYEHPGEEADDQNDDGVHQNDLVSHSPSDAFPTLAKGAPLPSEERLHTCQSRK
jgi:hypothetical protein